MGPNQITYCECFARDGLQNLPTLLPTATKIEIIDRFSNAGIPMIEATSFAHPKYLPQFADAEEILKGIQRKQGTQYVGLVPNLRGLERAIALGEAGRGVDAIILIVSASEAYNQANSNRTVEETLTSMEEIVPKAKSAGIYVIASISCSFGCHLEGKIDVAKVEAIAKRFRELGADEIMNGDTTGCAHPIQVGEFFSHLIDKVPGIRYTAHFHDTRGTAMANALAAWQAGVERFDGSLGGIGGKAFGVVEGAEDRYTGNVASEDLLGMFEQMGVGTGIDMPYLLETVRIAEARLGQKLNGRLAETGLTRF